MILLLSEGQVSDYRGAERVLPALPDANTLLADRGYDGNWFRQALAVRDIAPFIPGRKNRKKPIEHDTELYKQRNRVERMFGRLKDWRRIATRYDRCAHTFMSAICIAATVIFWLSVLCLGTGPTVNSALCLLSPEGWQSGRLRRS